MHSYELETLAIVYALRKFRDYLHGIKFKVVTDCSALSLTFDKKNICPKIARWALELQHFTFSIQHRSGVLMSHVDALSRCHPPHDTPPIDYQSEIMSRMVTVCALTENNIDLQEEDPNEETEEAEFEKKIPCKVVTVANRLELDFMIQVTQNRDEKILALRIRLEVENVNGFELKG